MPESTRAVPPNRRGHSWLLYAAPVEALGRIVDERLDHARDPEVIASIVRRYHA